MQITIWAYFLTIILTNGTFGLLISELDVPPVVRANVSKVIIDCKYDLEDWEREGLVVKWYIGGLHLVYQWIPPMKPQALGVLSGRADLSYKVSKDPLKAQRALVIKRPDPSLSGSYSCSVSNFEDEDIRQAQLLVWAPAASMELTYSRPSEQLVNITCYAHKVAPKPVFNLYIKDSTGNGTEIRLRGASSSWHKGLWSVGVWGLLRWSRTETDSVLGCSLFLPGTNHSETREKVYNKYIEVETTTTTTSTMPPPTDSLRHSPNLSSNVAPTRANLFDFPSIFGNGCSQMLADARYLYNVFIIHLCALKYLTAVLV